MSERGKRKRGCESCRTRHIKCDEEVPCTPCVKRKLPCNKGEVGIRFRPVPDRSQLAFPTAQPWFRTSGKRIDFVDQSLEIARRYEDGDFLNDDDLQGDLDESPLNTIEAISKSDASFSAWLVAHQSARPAEVSHSKYHQHVNFTQSGSASGGANAKIAQAIHISLFDEIRFQEAFLLRHYIETLGPSFDAYDPSRRLGADVAERALSFQPLLNLIFVASASHLGVDAHNIDQLQTNPFSINDDAGSLAASYLVLQLIENMEGSSSQIHIGVESSQLWDYFHLQTPTSKNFLEATLLAVLRQEVFLAVLNQRPISNAFQESGIDSYLQTATLGADSDYMWCNHMLLHLLDTLKYCFGDSTSTLTYEGLWGYAATWMESKPAAFTPVLAESPPEGSIFPKIWFMNESAAAGMQYYHLVRILLVAHNPKVPQLGRGRKAATTLIEEQIRDDVKIVCGIADSMDTAHFPHLPACMAVALAGDRFLVREEQNLLLDLLIKTTKSLGWSTSHCQTYLKETWGWAE